ncbi:hypothetical protein [Microaceticoccus formicicus]|uniref:hypothetical protein n=1 Tax=Microaceticoccus formicicus TaxID=3118105 RepID=UPI003CD031E0|nr:hypothetical protein VZL98_01690 [Peptoniphilaceae bacterium AMB_02]
MEKTLKIDGKDVKFKVSASFAYRYKAQFGSDIMQKLMPLLKGIVPLLAVDFDKLDIKDRKQMQVILDLITTSDLANDFELVEIYNLIWVMAKTADTEIPEPMEWLDGFDEFPLAEIVPPLIELLVPSLFSTKEIKKKTTTRKTTSK